MNTGLIILDYLPAFVLLVVLIAVLVVWEMWH